MSHLVSYLGNYTRGITETLQLMMVSAVQLVLTDVEENFLVVDLHTLAVHMNCGTKLIPCHTIARCVNEILV